VVVVERLTCQTGIDAVVLIASVGGDKRGRLWLEAAKHRTWGGVTKQKALRLGNEAGPQRGKRGWAGGNSGWQSRWASMQQNDAATRLTTKGWY